MSHIKHNFVFNMDQHKHISGFVRNHLAWRDQLELKFLMFLLQDEISGGFFALHLIKKLNSVQTLFQ